MKKLIYPILGLALTFLSCEQDLIQVPETDKVTDNFYTNEAELEEAVNAVYATLQFSGAYDIALPAIGELPGEDSYDETPANDGGNYGQLDQFNVLPRNSLIGNIWTDSYKGIQRANIVLERIEPIEYLDEAVKEARVGEMKFIRALYYFNLVRIYGDVPLVLEEVQNPQEYFGQARTPKAEVYDAIKQDLADAVPILPVRNESNKGRVTKSAAQTLKGKVELTLGNYTEAETSLLKIVNSGSHGLLSDVNEIFSTDNEWNKEIIFAVNFASGINSNSEGTDAYRMFNPTGRLEGNMTGTKGHGVLKNSFYELYSGNDQRKDVYVRSLESQLAYSNKVAIPTISVGDAESNWVVLRYADVLLMLSEISNELGNYSVAVDYLNQVRSRAGLPAYGGSLEKQNIFKAIDLERRKELVWEGHRWFDLLRQGRAKDILGISDYQLLMPLPASQIAADPALKQNPGY